MTSEIYECRQTGSYASMYIGLAICLHHKYCVSCILEGPFSSEHGTNFDAAPFNCQIQELCLSV